MTQKHTPTPWTSCGANIHGPKLETSSLHVLIGTLSCGIAAPTPLEAALNAAFIVKACNRDKHFDELVKAMHGLLDYIGEGEHEEFVSSPVQKAISILAKVQS